MATCRSRAIGSVEHSSKTWGRAFIEMWHQSHHFHYEHQNVLKSSPVSIINNIIITPTSATLLGVAWISRRTWIQSPGSARWTACKVSFLQLVLGMDEKIFTRPSDHLDHVQWWWSSSPPPEERINLNLKIFTARDLQHIYELLELLHQHLHHITTLLTKVDEKRRE